MVESIFRVAEKRGLEQGMERGLEQGMERGLEQGTISGIVKMCKKFGNNFMEAVSNVLDVLPSLSQEEAEKKVKAIW